MPIEVTPRDDEQLLAERAARLARPLEQAADSATVEVMTFDLCGENYALATEQLREVFAAREVTPLPCTPAWVSGILNVRGHILTVLDLAGLLGLQSLAEPETVLVLNGRQGDVALLAGDVTGVRVLPAAAFEFSTALSNTPYVRGMTSDGLILLDARLLLDDQRLVVRG